MFGCFWFVDYCHTGECLGLLLIFSLAYGVFISKQEMMRERERGVEGEGNKCRNNNLKAILI